MSELDNKTVEKICERLKLVEAQYWDRINITDNTKLYHVQIEDIIFKIAKISLTDNPQYVLCVLCPEIGYDEEKEEKQVEKGAIADTYEEISARVDKYLTLPKQLVLKQGRSMLEKIIQ